MKKIIPLVLALLLLLPLSVPAHATPTKPVSPQTVLSGELEYACNPSSTTYNVEGAWPDGTVLENRTCIHYQNVSGKKVSAYAYWRVRNGGTPIPSDWDLNGTNGPATREMITSSSTGFNYGFRSDYGDAIGTSIVRIQSYWGCSNAAVPQVYYARSEYVSANPSGPNGASGYHSATSDTTNDSLIGC